jgi:hypothetical protein
MNKTLGIILIALGLFDLAWGGFSYTTREKVVDIGLIHATREKTHSVLLPPVAGGPRWRCRVAGSRHNKGLISNCQQVSRGDSQC